MSINSAKETPRKAGQRILSLWFPYLAAERVLRQRLGRSWRSRPQLHAPLALSRHENNTRRIAALDERAEALGLKRGMGLADARAMHPGLDVVEADADADRRLLEGLADWCDRYTPLVALDGEDALFLDVTGCAALFGGERAMLDGMLARFFQQGFEARAAIASTAGAAWAAARYAGASWFRVRGRGALSPLPLAGTAHRNADRAALQASACAPPARDGEAARPLARRFGAACSCGSTRHSAASTKPSRRAAGRPALGERQLAEPSRSPTTSRR